MTRFFEFICTACDREAWHVANESEWICPRCGSSLEGMVYGGRTVQEHSGRIMAIEKMSPPKDYWPRSFWGTP